jgi:hypothetical protein
MLALIKTLHASVYAAVAAAIFYVLYSGVTGTLTVWTGVSIGLVVAECIVFVVNGFHCPLTQLAQTQGAPKGYVGESFLPERVSSRIFQVLGALFVVGLVLVLLRVL